MKLLPVVTWEAHFSATISTPPQKNICTLIDNLITNKHYAITNNTPNAKI